MLWCGVLITVLYNIYVITKCKTIPTSLSETSYLIGQYWFMSYCLLMSTILPTMLDLTQEQNQWAIFLMFGGMLMSGFSPMFKEGLDKKVHYGGAIVSFVSYMIYMFLEMNVGWIVGYVCLVLTLIRIKKELYVYFAELIAVLFLCIEGAL